MYVMDARPSVKSAVRTVELLEFIAASAPAVSVMEVATALGYPQSSTSMLLSSLEKEGYLFFDRERRCYSLGVRAAILGVRLDAGGLGCALARAIARFHEDVGQTVVVGLHQGIHVRQVYSMNAVHINPVIITDGTLRPVCRTAMGRVLLASLPDAEVARIARTANSSVTRAEDKVSVQALLAELPTVRTSGWSRTLDYPAPDRAALAMMVPAKAGQPRLAISVGARKSVMTANQKDYLKAMRVAVDSIAGVLGGHELPS
jgi:DNA-binding IclR family transcriptional regulator